jgi:hypothetical protein
MTPAMSKSSQDEFQNKFAEWFYGTGMAFMKISIPQLENALKILRQYVRIPSRDMLSGLLLDKSYDKAMQKILVLLHDEYCTLTTDGWTDINGNSVINYVVASRKGSFFLESVYTGSDGHTSDYLSKDIIRVIEKHSDIQICGVVTDNTATNKKAWEILQKVYPEKFFHGCVSHTLHLLTKDIIKSFQWLKDLVDGTRELVVYIKKKPALKHVVSSYQEKNKLKSLVIPGETRWGTILACIKSVSESEEVIYQIMGRKEFISEKGINSEERKKRKRMQTLIDNDFRNKLKKAINFLSPIDI